MALKGITKPPPSAPAVSKQITLKPKQLTPSPPDYTNFFGVAGGAADPGYAKQVVSHPAMAVTTKQIVKQDTISEYPSVSEVVHPGIFNQKNTGVSVAFSAGRTINLGNFTSAKIGVTITVPCDPERVDEVYVWASQWAGDKLEKEIKDAQGEL